ncbi:MAG TPA: hypothetical protein VFH94_08520 [Streptomyces sp.]|nr:hypothetical protein [Streptomyces sp.]
MSEKITKPGTVKPQDEHASSEPMTAQVTGTPITPQDEHASGEKPLTTQDEHASGGKPN